LGSQNYSQATRDTFIQLAADIFDAESKRNQDQASFDKMTVKERGIEKAKIIKRQQAALSMMGKLGEITDPKAKERMLAVLTSGLNDPALEEDTVTVLTELGSQAKDLVPIVRTSFKERDIPADDELKFLRLADTSDESVKLAQDYLLKGKDQPHGAILEAYLLLKKSQKIPTDLSPEIIVVVGKAKKSLQDRFDAAIEIGNEKGVLECVKDGVGFCFDENFDSQELMITAAKKGSVELLKFAIEKGANIHAGDDFPLLMAAENGHLSTVKYLVENGANIHARDDYALRWAAENGHLSIVNFLQDAMKDKRPNLFWRLLGY